MYADVILSFVCRTSYYVNRNRRYIVCITGAARSCQCRNDARSPRVITIFGRTQRVTDGCPRKRLRVVACVYKTERDGSHLIRRVHDQLSLDGVQPLFLVSREHFVSGRQKRVHVRYRPTCRPRGQHTRLNGFSKIFHLHDVLRAAAGPKTTTCNIMLL